MKRLLLIFVISAIMPELLHAQLHTRLLVHFDEGSGTIAHDSSGNNLHGTLGGVPTWTSGYVGGGLQFDGNGDRVDFGSSDLLRPDILTCEAWIYADSLRQQEMLIVTSGKDFNGFVLSLREGGKPSFDCQGSGSRHIAMSPDPLTIHQWHHLAGTFDGTTVRIFVNGACRASVLGTLSPATYPLLVGTDVTPPYTSDPFFGKIDEVQITDTVRYLCGENCAISLDGITAYGAVPDNPVLQFGSGNFTMEVMVRVDRIGTVYDFHLVTKGRYSNIAYFRLGIYLGTNWPVFCGASNNIEWNATSPDPISIGEWHHIAGVREGNTYILYVDGIEKARANLAVGSVDTNDSLFIGYLPMADPPPFFPGDVDEVRLWNVARSASDIADNVCRELSGSPPGLVAYYQFNSCAGTTIEDNAASPHDGVLRGSYQYVTADWCPENVVERAPMPIDFFLNQNYPNPFNASTEIGYAVAMGGPVKMEVLNILGQHVVTLVDAFQSPGSYRVIWNGKDDSGNAVGSGVYMYLLENRGQYQGRKMILIR